MNFFLLRIQENADQKKLSGSSALQSLKSCLWCQRLVKEKPSNKGAIISQSTISQQGPTCASGNATNFLNFMILYLLNSLMFLSLGYI